MGTVKLNHVSCDMELSVRGGWPRTAVGGNLPTLAGLVAVLGTGLGLGALRLLRLFRAASLPTDARVAPGLKPLLGRAFLTPGLAVAS